MQQNYDFYFRRQFRFLINIFIKFIFFIINFIILIINSLKILDSEIIIVQNVRIGFGNIFTSIDLSRKIFGNKKILFISFYDSSRHHNKKIYEFLNEKKLIFYTSFYLKFRKSRFGEYENPKIDENILQKFLIQIINYLKNKNCKVLNIPELYYLAAKKAKKLKYKKYNFLSLDHLWLTYYYYLIDKDNTLKINKKNKIINNLTKNASKSICFYKREKGVINKVTKNYDLFFKLIKFFFKKKYKIYLTGEYSNLLKVFPQIKKFVELPEKKKRFDQNINLAMQLTSNYYIGDYGGGSYFAMFKKKSIILGNGLGNCFPNHVKTFNYKYYYKNINVETNKRFRRTVNNQIKNYKTPLDPYFAYKLGYKVKNFNHNLVLNYVKKNFQ